MDPVCEEQDAVAIVGMAGRFPGARDVGELWRNLCDGVESIRFYSDEELRERGAAPAWLSDPHFVPAEAAPDGIDLFDAEFFGYSPREAQMIDPQHRLFLECAWEALEHAGHPPSLHGGGTAVFAAGAPSSYLSTRELFANQAASFYPILLGNALDYLASRVAFKLDLKGPALTSVSACSSTLAVIHLASQALLGHECDLALAGGASIRPAEVPGYFHRPGGPSSPDGHCRSFDARAAGTVFGNGVGVVVLKRLGDALRDGDTLYAIVRGSAINNDGARKAGFTAPSPEGQAQVIAEAMTVAGVEPEDISYVEAHGTGTELGDPIEIAGLTSVFRAGTSRKQYCALGSAKTNHGHLDAAAGIAGVIKTALALKHRLIPPTLHFTAPNPKIDFASSPFYVNTTLRDWPAGAGPRRAGVSSFGMGGANGHVVLEEPPDVPGRVEAPRPWHLLPLSAKGEPALRELAGRWGEHLAAHPGASLGDLGFTAGAGREHFSHRAAVVASSASSLREALAALADGREDSGLQRGVVPEARPRIAFLFSGQGAQYPGMGRSLYESEPAFRATLERCAAIFDAHLARPLLDVLLGTSEESRALLQQTGYTQPALFAIEVALAELWRSWGVVPDLVLGHSVGELAAACAAGVFSPEDGARLVAARARLMQDLPPGGAMAAVALPEEMSQALVRPHAGRLAVAAVNAPEQCVLSGDREALEAALSTLGEEVRVRQLEVSHAFHSPRMDPILDAFEEEARAIPHAAPRIGLISNLSAQVVGEAGVLGASYWRRHLRQTVRFADGIRTLAGRGCNVFLEVGPGVGLLSPARRCLPGVAGAWLPSLRAGSGDWQQLLTSAAQLYVRGAALDWAGFHRGRRPGRVAAPTYPFQRRRHWLDLAARRALSRLDALPAGEGSTLAASRASSPLLAVQGASELREVRTTSRVDLAAFPYLGDHRLYGRVVFPGAGYVELALAATAQLTGRRPQLEDLVFREPMVLGEDEMRTLEVTLEAEADGAFALRIASRGEGAAKATLHVQGRARPAAGEPPAAGDAAPPGTAGLTPCAPGPYYERLQEAGLEYGPGFQGLEEAWHAAGRAAGWVRLPPAAQEEDADAYLLHPVLLDACFQLLLLLRLPDSPAGQPPTIFMPLGIEALHFHATPRGRVFCEASLRPEPAPTNDTFAADLRLTDGAGVPLVELRGLLARRARRDKLSGGEDAKARLYEVAWHPQPARESTDTAIPTTPSRWLLLGDRTGAGAALAAALAARGHRTVDLDGGPEQLREKLAALGAEDRGQIEVVHLQALDLPKEVADGPSIQQALQPGIEALLAVVRGLSGETAVPARLWMVTRGAQPVGTEVPAVAPAALWGLGRVLAREHPSLWGGLIDLDPSADSAANATLLASELLDPSGEDQLAFRGGERLAARLAIAAANPPPASSRPATPGEAFRLYVDTPGSLESLVFRATERHPPGPGEVAIEVRAAALNFINVLMATGAYPGQEPGKAELGSECSGVVVAVGEGVEGIVAGDEVVAIASSFGSFVTASARLVALKPPGLSWEEAAGLPVAYCTAYQGLHHLAGLRRGERVLIHLASGGTGQAALQVARRAGAEIFATAGTPEKREHVRGLGVAHVMDSRSLDFATEVRRLTGGEGVDVVLNSLAGESLAAGLGVLRHHGRFVDISKKDIYEDRPLGMGPFRRSLSYLALDLDGMKQSRPEQCCALIRETTALVASGELAPLPVEVFPAARAREAFRRMAQGRHIGKVVLSFTAVEPVQLVDATAAVRLRPDATYLVTGGLGGLGLEVARWLAGEGARHLLLMGRSAPSAEARRRLAELEAAGAQVETTQADVARPEDVARALGTIPAERPLRGVIHAAGVLADGVLLNQKWERFAAVLGPKVAGAWNLHVATRELPLDFFVLFSSGTSILGNAGQGNYATANAFLDALAHHRRRQGLCALAINWGAWSEVGMAAQGPAAERAGQLGLVPLRPSDGVAALERLLGEDRTQVAVMPIRWPRYLEAFASAPPPFLAEVARGAPASATRPRASSLQARLEQAPPQARRELLRDHVRDQVARVLGLAAETVDPSRPLMDMGLDSLLAIDLRSTLQLLVGDVISLPNTLIFRHPTVNHLVSYLAGAAFGLEEAAGAPAAEPRQAPEAMVAEVAALSQGEAEAQLAEELAALEAEGLAGER